MHTKRSYAPAFWKFARKAHRFTVTASPGPHPKLESYPLAVLVRDVLKVARTQREAKAVIKSGKLQVDGVVRKEPSFPVGLMDVIEIPVIKKVIRLVPKKGSLLPFEISESERSLKLCKVRIKETVKEGKLQYGLHDGRCILSKKDLGLRPGDSCLIEVPSQKVVKTVKLEKGALAMVISGKRSGQACEVIETRPGTFTEPPTAKVGFGGETTELPTDLLLVVGKGKPLITLPV